MKNNKDNQKNNVIDFGATEDKRKEDAEKSHKKYAEFLKSLDDRETAKQFRDKKLERATELLAQIFMATSGVFEMPEKKDWAQEIIIELLEILHIRHDNFNRSDFIEDLQEYVFKDSMSYFHRYVDWKRDILAERGLDEHGIEFEPEPPVARKAAA